MTEQNTYKCPQKTSLSSDKTIRELLKFLRQEAQRSGWAPDAVQQLGRDITDLESAYDGIADLVTAYEKVYPDFQKAGPKYCEAERQWHNIEKLALEAVKATSLSNETKQAIEALRNSQYRDETEESPSLPLPDTHPKKLLEKAQEANRIVKSCLDQRIEEEQQANSQYTNAKGFTAIAGGWFTGLKALQDQAQNDFDKNKYKHLYATYLEAKQVWKKIDSTQDPESFRTQLIQRLKTWLIAKHERFLWQNDFSLLQQKVTDAQTISTHFTTTRQINFLREAEDVIGKAGSGGDGGFDAGSKAA